MHTKSTSSPTEILTLQNKNEIEKKLKKRLRSLEPNPYVLKYLDGKIRSAKGKHFKVRVETFKETVGSNHADRCLYQIFDNSTNRSVYKSDKLTYRDRSDSERVINANNQLLRPAILEESPESVTYCLRTAAGEIKVYTYRKGGKPEQLACSRKSDIHKFRIVSKQYELLPELLNDTDVFTAYISKEQEHPWRLVSTQPLPDVDVCVAISAQYGNGIDGALRAYRLHVWRNGIGLASTDPIHADSVKTGSRFHAAQVDFEPHVDFIDSSFMTLRITVACNHAGNWGREHALHVDSFAAGMHPFKKELRKNLAAHMVGRQRCDQQVLNSSIVALAINTESRAASWVLREVKRGGCAEYSLWSKCESSDIVEHDASLEVNHSDPELFLKLQAECEAALTNQVNKSRPGLAVNI